MNGTLMYVRVPVVFAVVFIIVGQLVIILDMLRRIKRFDREVQELHRRTDPLHYPHLAFLTLLAVPPPGMVVPEWIQKKAKKLVQSAPEDVDIVSAAAHDIGRDEVDRELHKPVD